MVVWEQQPERAFNAVRPIEFNISAACGQTRGWAHDLFARLLVVLDSRSLLQVYGRGGLLGHVVKRDKVGTDYTEMTTTPRLSKYEFKLVH